MDIVFPQYYEWHGEMEKLCRAAGLTYKPEKMHRIFCEIDSNAQTFLEHFYSEEVPHPNKNEARKFWTSVFNPVLAGEQLAAIAYFRTLESSSDLSTSKIGNKLLSMLFLKLLVERFVNVLREAEKHKKSKNAKKK